MKKAEMTMRELVELIIVAMAILFVFLPITMSIYQSFFVSEYPLLNNRIEDLKYTLESTHSFDDDFNIKFSFPSYDELEGAFDGLLNFFENDNYYNIYFKSDSRLSEICYSVDNNRYCKDVNSDIQFYKNGERCEDYCVENIYRDSEGIRNLEISFNRDYFEIEGVVY